MERNHDVLIKPTLNAYEIMFITKPFEDETIDTVIEKYEKLLTDNNSEVEHTDRWGQKRLAYTIRNGNKDFDYGFYVLITFNAVSKTVLELDRVMSIDENILRHMIIRK